MADQKQVERLSKIRSLAMDNPSKEEGATAWAMLGELMVKHGVTTAMLDAHEGRRKACRPPQASPVPNPFDGVVVEIVPGQGFGSVFGFGFGFSVHFGTGTSGSGSSEWTWTG